MKALDGQRCPCNEPTPSDRDDTGVEVRHLLHNLQPHRPLAGQNVGVIVPGQTQVT